MKWTCKSAQILRCTSVIMWVFWSMLAERAFGPDMADHRLRPGASTLAKTICCFQCRAWPNGESSCPVGRLGGSSRRIRRLCTESKPSSSLLCEKPFRTHIILAFIASNARSGQVYTNCQTRAVVYFYVRSTGDCRRSVNPCFWYPTQRGNLCQNPCDGGYFRSKGPPFLFITLCMELDYLSTPWKETFCGFPVVCASTDGPGFSWFCVEPCDSIFAQGASMEERFAKHLCFCLCHCHCSSPISGFQFDSWVMIRPGLMVSSRMSIAHPTLVRTAASQGLLLDGAVLALHAGHRQLQSDQDLDPLADSWQDQIFKRMSCCKNVKQPSSSTLHR